MDLGTAYKIARTLMNENGLTDVPLEWSNSRVVAGTAYHRKFDKKPMKMELSRHIMAIRDEAFLRDTALHEIAHLLTPGHNHDYVWSSTCRRIGGDGNRTYHQTEEHAELANYIGTCPNGHKNYRQQKSDKMFRVSCGKCSPGRYNAAYHYTWVDTRTGLTMGQTRVAGAPLQRAASAPVRTKTRAPEKGFTSLDDLFGTGD